MWLPSHNHLALTKTNTLASPTSNRILAADTLWMAPMHHAQLSVCSRLLCRSDEAARIFVVAGLHSGRRCVRSFLRLAVSKEFGFSIVSAQEVDRKAEEEGLVWDTGYLTMDEEDQEDDGIEEERRRWLLEVELKWARV